MLTNHIRLSPHNVYINLLNNLIFSDLDPLKKQRLEAKIEKELAETEFNSSERMMKVTSCASPDPSQNFDIKVYEHLLDVLRNNELDILNSKRAKHIQSLQVADPKWFEAKDTRFYKDHRRNRKRLGAGHSVENKIRKLMDDTLY